MPNRLNKFKKLGLAISYAAFISASNAYALDQETKRAQEEQFDIFDVETKDLVAPIVLAQTSAESKRKSKDKSEFPDFSQFDSSDDDEFIDDLFVDSVDENGDIEQPLKTKKQAENKPKLPTTPDSIPNNAVEDTNDISAPALPTEENDNEEKDSVSPVDVDEELKMMLSDSESTETEIDDNLNAEMAPEIEPSTEADKKNIPSDDDVGFVFENDGSDDDIKIPEEEEFKRLLIEGIDGEGEPLDILLNNSDKEEGSLAPELTPPATSNNLPDTSINAPEMPDTNIAGSSNNDKSPEVNEKYRDLKKHLSNFLLSFAGEDELSKSTTSNIHNLQLDDEGDDNDDSLYNNINSDFELPPETGSLENIETPIEDPNANPIAGNSLPSPEDNLDAILNTEIEIEKDNRADKLKEEEKQRLALEQKKKEEELRKEQERKKSEKQRLVMGSCSELPDKIANCQSYRCTMPNTVNRELKSVVSIKKAAKGKKDNVCNYSMETKGMPTVSCKFDDSDTSLVSIRTQTYFDDGGDKDLDMKYEFPKKCKTVKVAQKHESQKEKTKENKKPAKLELSSEDKAYMEMLDKKRKELPEHKQLSDSVIDTIKKVAPSLSDKKKAVKKDTKPKNVEIAHGDTGPEPSEEDGTKISNTGMDISLSTTTNQQTEIRSKMEKAYRALLSGQTSAAVVLYKDVLKLDKKNMDALFGLATAYHRNYQYEQARSIYAQILSIEPDNKEVLNNFLVLVAEESPESALIELQKLERINSSFSPIPAQIAMIYLKIGQPETAERYLRRAVILSPENITYKYNLAITSDKLHKYYQAINLYKQVLDAAKNGAVIPGSTHAIAERMDYLEGKLSSMN